MYVYSRTYWPRISTDILIATRVQELTKAMKVATDKLEKTTGAQLKLVDKLGSDKAKNDAQWKKLEKERPILKTKCDIAKKELQLQKAKEEAKPDKAKIELIEKELRTLQGQLPSTRPRPNGGPSGA